MAFDENLAIRIGQKLSDLGIDFEEKKMFGGLSFLFQGKMTIGIIKDDLAVRILSPHYEEELSSNPHTRPMDFTKKPLKEFLYVSPEGFRKEKDLERWIGFGMEHAKSKLGLTEKP